MKLLLDTHAFLWWIDGTRSLGRRGAAAVSDPDNDVFVSIASCWELAMLAARGRIELDRDPGAWMEDALVAERIELLPLTPAIAVASAQLVEFHGDPADRLIVATALVHGAALVTRDERIARSGQVKTIW